ncbi:hypothetical protein ACVRZR_06535 [Streptococcus entericus]|uniref:hypothetical protein n=1 Tax=Streptococcus entericus TaxID=155680 RepID=UPI00037AF692|nr:hypothetical protein [Streptococcus entericus]
MKKILSVLALLLSVVFLVSCSSSPSVSDNMDGEYFTYSNNLNKMREEVEVIVEGNTLTYYYEPNDKYLFSIDKEKQTLTGGASGKTVAYTFDRGKLSFAFLDSVNDYYLKDSPAYQELLKQSK